MNRRSIALAVAALLSLACSEEPAIERYSLVAVFDTVQESDLAIQKPKYPFTGSIRGEFRVSMGNPGVVATECLGFLEATCHSGLAMDRRGEAPPLSGAFDLSYVDQDTSANNYHWIWLRGVREADSIVGKVTFAYNLGGPSNRYPLYHGTFKAVRLP